MDLGKNRTTQEKLFKHMCNFGSRAEWRDGKRVVTFYLDVDTDKDKFCLLNPTPLDYITDYTMYNAEGERDLTRLL